MFEQIAAVAKYLKSKKPSYRRRLAKRAKARRVQP